MPSILQIIKFNAISAITISIMVIIYSLYIGDYSNANMSLGIIVWAALYLSEIWNKVE